MMKGFQEKIDIYSIIDTCLWNSQGVTCCSCNYSLAFNEFHWLDHIVNAILPDHYISQISHYISAACSAVDSQLYICQILSFRISLRNPLDLASPFPVFVKDPDRVIITPEHCSIDTASFTKP